MCAFLKCDTTCIAGLDIRTTIDIRTTVDSHAAMDIYASI